MNNRRHLLIALGVIGFAPGIVLGQSKQPVVIGWLNVASRKVDATMLGAFKDGLAALGWKEGAQYVLEERWADGRVDRLPALAAELAAIRPAVIVAATSSAVRAAAKAAPGTPVVQANGTSPVAAKLAASLARPGGMVTGVTNVAVEIAAKYIELLLAAASKLRRIAFLVDSSAVSHPANMETVRRIMAHHKVEFRIGETRSADEIEPVIERLAKDNAQALILMPSLFFQTERDRLARLALARRWPTIAPGIEFTVAGMLLSYGLDRAVLFSRTAWYVDKILKGAKPGDLPIEQPTKFELVVNLKTAKALGLTIPQPFLMRADRVIE